VLSQAVSKEADAGIEEQANALRVMAEAEEKLARYEYALQHYQSALKSDRALGLSERIGEDLNGMARVARQLGLEQDAIYYFQRAEWVNNSIRRNKN
jgi:tetratricopeptide (TPR) repeat protein